MRKIKIKKNKNKTKKTKQKKTKTKTKTKTKKHTMVPVRESLVLTGNPDKVERISDIGLFKSILTTYLYINEKGKWMSMREGGEEGEGGEYLSSQGAGVNIREILGGVWRRKKKVNTVFMLHYKN